MNIKRDERKRIKHLAKHDLDFGDLEIEFFSEALIIDARQPRLKAIGILSDDVVAVIFAALGAEGISLISLRPANRRERNLYAEYQAKAPYTH